MVFSKYFEAELNKLREAGSEYAKAHPSTAGLLAEKGDDPDVERLLEGLAFLTAQVRMRYEEELGFLAKDATSLLLPHYVRPTPAISIVQFKPAIAGLLSPYKIERGRELKSRPVQGTVCKFRTCFDVNILPIILKGVEEERNSSTQKIRVSLQTTDIGRTLISQESALRLFIHGETALATEVHLWILEYTREVRIRDLQTKSEKVLRAKDNGPAVRHPPHGQSHSLFPWPQSIPSGIRVLQEFFAASEVFRFFEIHGLDDVELEGTEFELVFELDRPLPRSQRLPNDIFRLHCTPVINIFRTTARPINVDYLAQAKPVVPIDIEESYAEVFSVESVTGTKRNGSKIEIPSFYSFEHVSKRSSAYYKIARSHSITDEGYNTSISIHTRGSKAPSIDEFKTLSIDLMCTNRFLCTDLNIRDICAFQRSPGKALKLENITAVTNSIRPPLGKEFHWSLLSHFSITLGSLLELRPLKSFLTAYNFGYNDVRRFDTNRLCVDAIRSIDSHLTTRIIEDAPVRGNLTVITLNEEHFPSHGFAYTFGWILDCLLVSYVGINSFNETKVILHPSKRSFSWGSKIGGMRSL